MKLPQFDTKKILIGVLVVSVLGAAYYFLSTSDISQVSVTQPNEEEFGKDILVLVDKLNQTSIDSSLFSSNLFEYLTDTSIPILSEVQGRPDPFAFIGVEIGAFVNTPLPTKSE